MSEELRGMYARNGKKVVVHTKGPSLTRQEDAIDADVNAIVARFIAHGTAPGNPGEARYGDFSSGLDFKTAADRVLQAQEDFEELPADIRKKCDNDVGKFIDIVYSGKREDLVEMGLLPKQDPTQTPPSVPPSGQDGSSPDAPEGAEGNSEGTTATT